MQIDKYSQFESIRNNKRCRKWLEAANIWKKNNITVTKNSSIISQFQSLPIQNVWNGCWTPQRTYRACIVRKCIIDKAKQKYYWNLVFHEAKDNEKVSLQTDEWTIVFDILFCKYTRALSIQRTGLGSIKRLYQILFHIDKFRSCMTYLIFLFFKLILSNRKISNQFLCI